MINGATGIIEDIIYPFGCSPPNDIPKVIMVRFDKYNGPSINGCVPIPPKTVYGNKCSRTQFPLKLCWATTIHQSQGLTLDQAIVKIGDEEKQIGSTYVAFSRVKSINGLALEQSFNIKRLQQLKNKKEIKQRINELERLKSLKMTSF